MRREHYHRNQPPITVMGIGQQGLDTIEQIIEQDRGRSRYVCFDNNKRLTSSKNITIIPVSEFDNPDLIMGNVNQLDARLHMVQLLIWVGSIESEADLFILTAISRLAVAKGIFTVGFLTIWQENGNHTIEEQLSNESSRVYHYINTIVTIPISDSELTASDYSPLFTPHQAQNKIYSYVTAVYDLITPSDLINIDLADLRAILETKGVVYLGQGKAKGAERAKKAATIASNIDQDMTRFTGANHILIKVSGNKELGLWEMEQAVTHIGQFSSPNATIIVGASIDEALEDYACVTIAATHFDYE